MCCEFSPVLLFIEQYGWIHDDTDCDNWILSPVTVVACTLREAGTSSPAHGRTILRAIVYILSIHISWLPRYIFLIAVSQCYHYFTIGYGPTHVLILSKGNGDLSLRGRYCPTLSVIVISRAILLTTVKSSG